MDSNNVKLNENSKRKAETELENLKKQATSSSHLAKVEDDSNVSFNFRFPLTKTRYNYYFMAHSFSFILEFECFAFKD
jgi:hypothetical protein